MSNTTNVTSGAESTYHSGAHFLWARVDQSSFVFVVFIGPLFLPSSFFLDQYLKEYCLQLNCKRNLFAVYFYFVLIN